ncbi:MAG: tetratricopeptide repeat protein, partial [Actinomycetota bacterium]|nr:tetratricopeptide repeat protein [Actinomycetota bacterium]
MTSAVAVIQGEYASARVLAEQGLELYRVLGDRPGTVRSLSNLGAILLAEGRAEDAVSALDESVALSARAVCSSPSPPASSPSSRPVCS